MKTALYTFKPNPLRNWLQLAIFGGGFVLMPIWAMFMSYSAGTMNVWVGLSLGVFLAVGIFLCRIVLNTKIVMYRDEMEIYTFKKRVYKYKDIKRITFKKDVNIDHDTDSGNSQHISYFFVLEFENKFTNKDMSDLVDLKIGGVEVTYGVDLKTLDSLEYKKLFLNTILKSNPNVKLDKIALAYKEGRDPGVMKHGSLVD